MKTFVALFVVSALFGLAIGATYWFVAHEEATGTMLLAIMTAALSFAALYAILAERHADLAGDRSEAQPASDAGEDLGTFTTHSPWPIVIACCALGALTGTLWSPFLAAVSLVGLVICLWRLGAESAEASNRGAGR